MRIFSFLLVACLVGLGALPCAQASRNVRNLRAGGTDAGDLHEDSHHRRLCKRKGQPGYTAANRCKGSSDSIEIDDGTNGDSIEIDDGTNSDSIEIIDRSKKRSFVNKPFDEDMDEDWRDEYKAQSLGTKLKNKIEATGRSIARSGAIVGDRLANPAPHAKDLGSRAYHNNPIAKRYRLKKKEKQEQKQKILKEEQESLERKKKAFENGQKKERLKNDAEGLFPEELNAIKILEHEIKKPKIVAEMFPRRKKGRKAQKAVDEMNDELNGMYRDLQLKMKNTEKHGPKLKRMIDRKRVNQAIPGAVRQREERKQRQKKQAALAKEQANQAIPYAAAAMKHQGEEKKQREQEDKIAKTTHAKRQRQVDQDFKDIAKKKEEHKKEQGAKMVQRMDKLKEDIVPMVSKVVADQHIKEKVGYRLNQMLKSNLALANVKESVNMPDSKWEKDQNGKWKAEDNGAPKNTWGNNDEPDAVGESDVEIKVNDPDKSASADSPKNTWGNDGEPDNGGEADVEVKVNDPDKSASADAATPADAQVKVNEPDKSASADDKKNGGVGEITPQGEGESFNEGINNVAVGMNALENDIIDEMAADAATPGGRVRA